MDKLFIVLLIFAFYIVPGDSKHENTRILVIGSQCFNKESSQFNYQ